MKRRPSAPVRGTGVMAELGGSIADPWGTVWRPCPEECLVGPPFSFEVALFDSPLIRSPRGTPWDVTAGAAWQALFARRVSPSSPPVASVRAVRLPDA